jgi:hypothetical protein
MSANPPGPAITEPDRTHRIRDWVVPLRDGAREFEVRGTLDWVPPPTPALWWAGALLLAAFGVPARRGRTLAAAVALIAGGTTLGYAVARELDAGATSAGALLSGLFAGQVPVLLAALFAVTAAGLVPARRSGGDFALTLAGAALAVFAGFANVGVFAQAVAPVPGPSWWARVAVLIALGGGLALLTAGLLRLRAAAPPRPRTAWKLGSVMP